MRAIMFTIKNDFILTLTHYYMYIASTMCPEELFTDLIVAINENDALKKSNRVLSDENQHLKDRITWLEKQIFGHKQNDILQVSSNRNYPLMCTK